ncbi:MAG: alpha/beta hydrolase [Peptococcaceae bacterium]|nr:alpha/beta hydrolase [Peptococcaceae bacterium]
MKKKLISILLVLILAFGIGCFLYINDYYHANEDAIAVLQQGASDTSEVIVSEKDGLMVFLPRGGTDIGMIFYPGGKVEYSAYAPLLYQCARQGITCVLVEMPGNLAVLDMNAAEGIPERYTHVNRWYLAGHSLGGAMASSYLAKHTEDYEGAILLAAYATEALHGEKVLSVYGSEDSVLNMEKYEENKANLPEDYTEVVIEGGCHAYFGAYGSQDGDGEPSISAEQQWEITAQAVAEFVGITR